MSNALKQFYSNVVQPCVREFENDPSCLRGGYCAVWALDSFASHIYYHYRETCRLEDRGDIRFKSQLAGQSKYFSRVLDVSNATKHAVRSVKKPEELSLSRSDQVVVERLEGWSAYFSGVSCDKWGDYVTIVDGVNSFWPLLQTVQKSDVFLGNRCEEYERYIKTR